MDNILLYYNVRYGNGSIVQDCRRQYFFKAKWKRFHNNIIEGLTMKAFKKVAAMVMALTMAGGAFALAGCGGDEDGDTDELKVVKVWVHKSAQEDEGMVYAALAEQFNNEDFKTTDGRDIQVRIEFKNSPDVLQSSINAEVMTGGLPDIVAVDAPNIAAYANSGIIINIKDYISQDSLNDYVDSVIEQSTINGGLYALSGQDAPVGLYYNKELLSSVGYDESDIGTIENPWTWDDLKSAMQTLKAAGKEYKINLRTGFGGDEGNMYLYSSLVYSAGGSFCDANGKTSGHLNSDQSVKGIQMLEWFFSGSKSEPWYYDGSNVDAFPQGIVAFEIYGPWEIENINSTYADFSGKYGIMPVPVYVEGQTKGSVTSGCGSWGFGVTNSAKDPQAAAQVVEYFTNAAASEMMYDAIGTFPTHKSSYANNQDFSSGAAKSLADIMQTVATPRPKTDNYAKITTAFADIIEYMQTKYGAADYDLRGYINQQVAIADA